MSEVLFNVFLLGTPIPPIRNLIWESSNLIYLKFSVLNCQNIINVILCIVCLFCKRKSQNDSPIKE